MAETTTAGLWHAWIERRDETAFAALVRPVIPHALAAAGRVAPGADPEGVVQDCLAELARERSRRPVEVGLRAWLVRAATLRARTAARSERRRSRRERGCSRTERTEPAGDRLEIREEIEAALADLSERDREAVLLRHLHDLEYEEVSRILGGSAGAARVRVHRAIQRLRRRLGPSVPALLATLSLPAARSDTALVGAVLAKVATPSTLGTTLLGGIAMKAATKGLLAGFVLAAAGTALFLVGRAGTPDRTEPDGSWALELENDRLQKKVERLETELAAATRPAPTEDTRTTPAAVVPPEAPPSRPPTTASPPPFDPDARKEATALTERWRADILQLEDRARRENALTEALGALSENDPVRVLAALNTLPYLWGIEYDRDRARPRVLDLLEAEEPSLRRSAMVALWSLKPGPEDLRRILPRVEDPDAGVRRAAAGSLPRLVDGVIEGPVAEAFLSLLDTEDPQQIRNTLSSLQRTKQVSPALEARLIELAAVEDFATRRNALGALGGIEGKSERVVEALFRVVVDHEDLSSRQTAALALRQVPEELREAVATRALEIATAADPATHPVIRSQCLALVAAHGSERHLPALRALLANDLATEADRRATERAIAAIERRGRGPR